MNEFLIAKVMEEELFNSIFSLKKGKGLGFKKLMVKFYLGFYDQIKEDIMEVVKESHGVGKMLHVLKSTHITLIPKEQDESTLDDFQPILFYNVIYKLVSKIIS